MSVLKPTLTINSHDYTDYIEELTPTLNELDADGSGRDVKTGLMYRTLIATKQKYDVKMLRLTQSLMQQLIADISPVYYQATITNPATGSQVTKSFYTSTIPCGSQRYDKDSGAPYYSGVSFSMTER